MSAPEQLLAVDEALARILAGAEPLAAEPVSYLDATGRTLAEPLTATRTQPPFPSSAMDGYAVRAADATAGAVLTVIGEAAAGHLFEGSLGTGQAVRIFTGGAVPNGADAVLIQENTERAGNRVTVLAGVQTGKDIRPKGTDYHAGDTLIGAGTVLSPRHVAIAAAVGRNALDVARKPRVAILPTGDELVLPGQDPAPGQITASNGPMIAGLVRAAGGEAIDLDLVGDRLDSIQRSIRRARDLGANILVSTGGASVGDHDLVQQALRNEGVSIHFWRIAMRPGRPMMFGQIGDMRVLGMPGNPISAHVCTTLFLLPLLRALQGRLQIHNEVEHAVLGAPLAANDWRADHLRANLDLRDDAPPVATPFRRQDSSLLKALVEADCLILRPPHHPAQEAGAPCRIIRLGENS